MERLQTFDKYVALTKKFMQPGVVTNLFLSKQRVQDAISAGKFYFAPGDRSLLFLLVGKVCRLYFMVLPGGHFPAIKFDGDTACELVYKRDLQRDVAAEIVKLGLSHVATRKRLERAPSGEFHPVRRVRTAAAGDLDAVFDTLNSCFDPLVGCLPDAEELAYDISAGRVLVADGGMLRFSCDGGACELNHLAVLPEARGRGTGSALVETFLATVSAKRFQLWVRTDNLAAQRLYSRFGFTPGKFSSEVFAFSADSENQ